MSIDRHVEASSGAQVLRRHSANGRYVMANSPEPLEELMSSHPIASIKLEPPAAIDQIIFGGAPAPETYLPDHARERKIPQRKE